MSLSKDIVCYILFNHLIKIDPELVYRICHTNDLVHPYFFEKISLVNQYCKDWRTNVTIRGRFQRKLRRDGKIKLFDGFILLDTYLMWIPIGDTRKELLLRCEKESHNILHLSSADFSCICGFKVEILFISESLDIAVFKLVCKYSLSGSKILAKLKF